MILTFSLLPHKSFFNQISSGELLCKSISSWKVCIIVPIFSHIVCELRATPYINVCVSLQKTSGSCVSSSIKLFENAAAAHIGDSF